MYFDLPRNLSQMGFQVQYGFQRMLPPRNGLWDRRSWGRLQSQRHIDYDNLSSRRNLFVARGHINWTWRPGGESCVSIRDIRSREKFSVRMLNGAQNVDGDYCQTHTSDPNALYVQQNRSPYRKLWYRVSGSIFSPECRFSHEE